jgi:hypothetical protein
MTGQLDFSSVKICSRPVIDIQWYANTNTHSKTNC